MSSLLFSSAVDEAARLSQLGLSPLFSGTLLLLIAYSPDRVQHGLDVVFSKLPSRLFVAPGHLVSAAKPALKTVFILSILHRINQRLNSAAANAWRIKQAKNWNWPDEIAVVTGGSSGIGASIVYKLAAMGVRVAVLDIQSCPKEMEENELVKFYNCDVSSAEAVAEAADLMRRELGHPTILINNAGITQQFPILKTPPKFLRRIFGVNVIALWLTTQQFLPHMIQMNKGHIVTVASIASFVALPTAADYSATKAAALSFHESLTCEIKHCYKSSNILTTVVHPSFVDTPLLHEVSDRLQQSGVRLLTSDRISNEIVSQLQRKKGSQLIIPQFMTGVSGIRGWPTWLQEVVRDVLGRVAARD